MHPIDSLWAFSHDGLSLTSCRACHGADDRGTVLSWAQGVRSYGAIGEQFWHGFQVGCYTCHAGPNGGDTGGGNPNSPPSVVNLSASTVSGTPVSTTLAGSDPNGDPITFRIVTQPAHGTVSLSGAAATFFPERSFVGSDSFTYAAWDGSTQSGLGTVALASVSGPCVLSASALVPTAAFPAATVPFRAAATLSQCASAISYDWDFGDGSPHASGTNVSHVYTKAADYTWTLKIAASGATQTVSRVLTISPTLGQPLFLTMTPLAWSMNLSWPADGIPTSLETTSDWTQPYAWQPDNDPVYSDGTNNNVQVYVLPGPQFFRLRRVP